MNTHIDSRCNQQPCVLLDGQFSDIESLASAVGWKQDFRQLDSGKLKASALVVGHEGCQALRIRFNRSFHQLGKPPGGHYVFGLPDVDPGDLRWAGQGIEAEPLVDFNGPEGLDMTSQGAFSGTVLFFRVDCFEANFDLLEAGASLRDLVGGKPYWRPEPGALDKLKAQLDVVFEIARKQDLEALREYQDSFDFEFALDILQVLGRSRMPPPPSSRSRANALRRALETIDSDPAGVMSVSALCRAVGASYSTLERAFLEEFAVPPKVYMRNRRLTAVQSELARGEGDWTIAEIAHEKGFWHMSAFAADYRKQFGELPSETHARSGKQ